MDDHNQRMRELLADQLRELRAKEIERAAERDASEKVAAMRRSGNQTTFTLLVGLFLMLLNAIMLVNIGVDVVWDNPVLVYLLAFSYLSGLFLTVYGSAQRSHNRVRTASYAAEVTEDMENTSRLRVLESHLKSLDEEEARKYRGGPLP